MDKEASVKTIWDKDARFSKQVPTKGNWLQQRQVKFPLQLTDTPPESERQILRCAPPFDAQAEHEADLRYESLVDYESWQYDGPEEGEDQ